LRLVGHCGMANSVDVRRGPTASLRDIAILEEHTMVEGLGSELCADNRAADPIWRPAGLGLDGLSRTPPSRPQWQSGNVVDGHCADDLTAAGGAAWCGQQFAPLARCEMKPWVACHPDGRGRKAWAMIGFGAMWAGSHGLSDGRSQHPALTRGDGN